MKLILFLGAGVSVPSKLPMASALTRMIFRSPYYQDDQGNFLSGKNPSATPKQTDATQMIRQLLRCLAEYDRRNSKNALYRKDTVPTYEDIYSLCQEITLWHLGLADNSIPTSFVKSIELAARPILKGRSLKARLRHLGFLSMEATSFIESVVSGALQCNLPVGLDLILDLATSQTIKQLNIITLNHDTLTEQCLHQKGIDFADGFGPRDGDVRWYDDGSYDSYSGKVRLFKIHGSVNWREFVGNPRPAIFLGSDIGNVMDGERRQLSLSRRSPSFLSGVKKEIAYQRGIYADAHFRFHDLLRQCKTIVMSGYGWGDTGINWRFDTWLDQDRRNKIVLLHPRPKEIVQRSMLVESAYDYWTRGQQLLSLPTWLSETSVRDLEELFYKFKG